MRKNMLLAAMLSLTVLMFAASPALADDFDDRFDEDGFFFIVDDDFDDFFFDDFDRFDDDFFFDDGFQDFEQDADSGDVDQSFEVTGGGDNSNQTVNVSGAANTGNLQDQFGFTQIDSEIDEFEIDDSGSNLTIGGDSEVSSDQEINQSASSGKRR